MIKRFLQIIWIILLPFLLNAQNPTKKVLGHEELATWKRILSPQISNDGNWVAYELKGEEGDGLLKVYNAQTEVATSFTRAEKAKFSFDSKFIVFKIKTATDSIRALKRQKVKKADFPKDSIGIFNLASQETERIPNVKSFKVPEKWSDFLIYHQEADVVKKSVQSGKDSTATIPVKSKKIKKANGKNGTKLIVRNLISKSEKSFPYVVNYILAKESKKMLFQTTGNDSTFSNGIYLYNLETEELKPIFRKKGDFKRMVFDENGNQLAFLANFDTTKALIPPFELAYWKNGMDSAQIIANNGSNFLPENWIVSEHETPKFSKNGAQLYFGMAPEPILQDTTLLEEEIVNVEVWHWNDSKLHTQQKVQQKRDERKAYKVVYHPSNNTFISLGSKEIPNIITADEGNAPFVFGYDANPYEKFTSWEAGPVGKNMYIIDTKSGTTIQIGQQIKGSPRFSPKGKFAYAYLPADSAWFAYEVATQKTVQLTNNELSAFYDELNDRPMHPYPAGIAGWLENDDAVLIYDRFDIWKIDPKGTVKPINLTKGRKDNLRYRYLRADKEKRFIGKEEKILLHVFNQETKESGYSYLDLKTNKITNLFIGPYEYSRRPIKANNAEQYIFTKGNFQVFPDLFYSDNTFKNPKQISIANPQQSEYSWGTMELFEWTAFNGKKLQGLLVKPENFDPTKKYPLIVNFYERNSDRLFRHKPPSVGRSTINYPFYASRGYLIFNPDVPYEVGYPGKSCYNAVVSGTQALIAEGFVDEKNIGIQGHSWGGYQIAHLLTKTDMFKCAESGAPVVNMFSAYGGIRWGSGRSRMFQYEQTQSRIGGTIWEYRDRYIENSPIFELDKTNTPVLILHNDEDTAVPWYQGIEYFVALRRLGKPAWLLNYNGEPHWPVKLKNRKDFNIRMQQYFDHYLKGAPMPLWMERGVSAVEKGKRQGLELSKQ